MKRYLAVLLALVLLLTGLAAIASAAPEYGGHHVWEDSGKVYYVKPDGSRVKGWYEYTMDEAGEGHWWIYGKDDGYLATGWLQIGGVWYYFDSYWGDMNTGSYYDFENKTAYLFSKDGAWTGVSATKPGWIQKGKDWYYVREDESGYWDENDQFVSDGTKYLYFATNGTYEIDNKMYAFSYGKMLSGGWAQPWKLWNDEDWVYANADGSLATGWKKIDGKWYYFGKWGWMYQDTMYWDWTEDGSKLNAVYAFDKSGAMVSNKWYEYKYTYQNDDGETFSEKAWLYMGASGAAKTGWFQVGGKWYYADEYGWLWMDAWVDDAAGNWYYLDESGAMVTGWYKYKNGEWLYFKDDGIKVESDWVKDGNSWYYMDANGNMVKDCTLNIGGKDYKFGADGAWIP